MRYYSVESYSGNTYYQYIHTHMHVQHSHTYINTYYYRVVQTDA